MTVIGLDPTVGWIAESKATQALWRNLIPRAAAAFVGMGDDREIVGAVSELPALALPPIGGLVLLLFGYIALIGPINYLVLKRIDRREWAWVTMPALIAVFAAGAYAYGSALRGSDMIVNEVAIVRGAPGRDRGSRAGLPGRVLADARHVPAGTARRGARLGAGPGRLLRRRRARCSTSSRASRRASATCPSASARCGRSGPRPRRRCRSSRPSSSSATAS